MFEHQTYDAILWRMLDRIPADVDKRQGSIIFDALAPAAAELAETYIEADVLLRLGFAGTSSGEWLERRVAEHGLFRRTASKAVRQGNFNLPVEKGERFYIEGLYFVVMKPGQIAELQCETAGAVGNAPTGTLQPVNYRTGLTSAVLGQVLIPGEDAESDESLRQRYKQKVTRPATSGNKAEYEQWAGDVAGVGAAKVFPLWNGPKTVKVVIVDAIFASASPALVQAVQTYIDPVQGQGEGKAPIGAHVTVESAAPKAINISATVTLAAGRTLAQAALETQKALDAYLRSIAFKETVVRSTQIGNLLLNAPSIIDYTNLLVNGSTANVALQQTEIPQRGTVTLT